MNIVNHAFFASHALLIARILIGGFFLLSGVSKFMDITGTGGYIESVGLPAGVALAWLAAILETVLGAAIIVGYRIKEAALLLAAFVFIVSFIFHGLGTWEANPMQQVSFMKNMAIVGAFLYIIAHGAGKTWHINAGSHTANPMGQQPM